MTEVYMPSVREALGKWGRWWRYETERHTRGSAVSAWVGIAELGRLGCRVQKTRRTSRSEEIIPPADIEEIGAVVESLPIRQRQAIARYYLHMQWRIARKRVRSPVLFRAEQAVGERLGRQGLRSRYSSSAFSSVGRPLG